MSEPARIPVVVCIDVEPDPRAVDLKAPPPWLGFQQTYDLLQPFRDPLSLQSGNPARLSWYLRMDPQVQMAYGSASWGVESNAGLVDRLRSLGDEIGLHVHSWRFDTASGVWVSDYSNAEWIDECLALSFSAFMRTIGRNCRTFRFGDRWMDQRTFGRLEALGIEIDLTLEPGYGQGSFYTPSESFSGRLPDFRQVPRRPYRPSAADYRIADPSRQQGIVALPVTTAQVQPALWHRLYNRWVAQRPATDMSTALISLEPSLFRTVVDDALEREHPHLVLPLRTGAAGVPKYASRVEANLNWLSRRSDASRFAWVTPAEAIQLLPL